MALLLWALLLGSLQPERCTELLAYDLIGCPRYVMQLSECEQSALWLCAVLSELDRRVEGGD